MSERKLYFSTAVEIATVMETAESGASQLTSSTSGPVNWIFKKKKRENRLVPIKPCYRCLGDHQHSTCPYSGIVNVSIVIRKDTPEQHVNVHHISNRQQIVTIKNQKQHNTYKLESDAVYDLFHVNPTRCIPPLLYEVLLNNKSCVMEIDTTGASVSLISEGQYKKTV